MISLAKLDAAARAWVGTPYRDNGCTRGVGASCHGLCWALYQEAGWVHDVPLPDGPSRWAGRRSDSPFVDFMDEQRDRFSIMASGTPVALDKVWPGYLLGFRIGSQIAHAGLALGDGQFVHALRRYGVQLRSLRDPTWGQRLAVMWRPKEPFIA